MKYIISEHQSEVYSFLRRVSSEVTLMKEIIKESLDLYDPCQYDFNEFLYKILYSSTETLLFSYYEINFLSSETGKILINYVMNFMDDRFRNLIFDYYDDFEC
jgi:hypothetical protein